MDKSLIMQFYEAIKDEDLTSIDECVEKGLMINKTYYYDDGDRYYPKKFFTPLICAVKNQSISVVEHLLKIGAVVLIKSDGGYETPLSVAARIGNLEIVKLLVENGAKPSMQTALLVAIENRRLEIVRYMVEKGVFVNWKYIYGHTPLSKSITTKCGEIAKFLIVNGAIINELGTNNCTPLVLSIQNQTLDILKYLIQKGASIKQIDQSTMQKAFMDAIEKNNLDFVQYLIEKGVSVNWKDKEGQTPLSKSITTDKCGKIAKLLIDSGADIEALNAQRNTPLFLSVENKEFEVMTHLLQKGANINAKIYHYDYYRGLSEHTALSLAASKRYFAFATYLIEFGADINLARSEVDEYAREDEDFNVFLRLFKMGQLKLKNSEGKKSSVTLFETESGGQEEAPPK